MHILWFTGVELPAVTGESLTRAGWQEGLRRSLQAYHPEIQLSIASFGPRAYQPFRSENATYYNILREPEEKGRWERLAANWSHRSFSETDLRRSYDIYQQVEPDLVFIFGTENPFGLLAGRFTVPAVISIQAVLNGLVGSLFQGLSLREIREELFSRKTLAGYGLFHKWWSHRRSARVERRIYRQVDYFCGRTAWDRSWQLRLNPDGRYFQIDRVLGEQYYQAAWKLKASAEDRIFSLCGNAPFKGGLTLVRALASLRSRTGRDLELRLAGVDQESMVGRNITRVIGEQGLEGQVHLLGRLERKQIIKEMQAARLFVLPSHMENSPNSLAEAMMLGMPCLASNAGGIPSLLADGKEGLIYPHQDIEALARGMEDLLANPEKAERLGQRARQTALERHHPERIARATEEMYRTVLGDGKAV